MQLQRLVFQPLCKRISSFQKKGGREFVLTVISFEDSTNSKIHTLPLALGSASLSVKDIDT